MRGEGRGNGYPYKVNKVCSIEEEAFREWRINAGVFNRLSLFLGQVSLATERRWLRDRWPPSKDGLDYTLHID